MERSETGGNERRIPGMTKYWTMLSLKKNLLADVGGVPMMVRGLSRGRGWNIGAVGTSPRVCIRVFMCLTLSALVVTALHRSLTSYDDWLSLSTRAIPSPVRIGEPVPGQSRHVRGSVHSPDDGGGSARVVPPEDSALIPSLERSWTDNPVMEDSNRVRAGKMSSDEGEGAQSGVSSEDLSIEDNNCRSRTKHLRLRSAEHQFPVSSQLGKALTEYEKMHAACTQDGWSDGFTKASNGKQACNYLVYHEGWEGIGNRVLSLVSAFVYALATRRVLLLESRGHLSRLLCEPFKNSSWILPAEFPSQALISAPSLTSSEAIWKEAAISLTLRHEANASDAGRFFCEETQQQLSNVTWIAWSSNQYYVPRMFRVLIFWKKLSPMFPNPSLVFTQLSRYLSVPKNSVWAQVERIHRAYLKSSDRFVGVQVRVPELREYSPAVRDKVMNCLIGHRILPNVSHTVKNQHTLKGRAFESKTSGNGRFRVAVTSGETVSVLVTSLESKYYEFMKGFYIDQDTNDGSAVSVHMMSHEGEERFAYDQSVKALVEIWLLSFADVLATSDWSTFGYVAQGLGGLRPLIMNVRNINSRFRCLHGQSVEPCNHYPFLAASKCGSSSQHSNPKHALWLKKHLKSCQDEVHGLQLA